MPSPQGFRRNFYCGKIVNRRILIDNLIVNKVPLFVAIAGKMATKKSGVVLAGKPTFQPDFSCIVLRMDIL